MLPKSHLTSHSRMSGSRGVITPLWLSGWWRSFLYRPSVYSCHPLKMGGKDYFKKCNHNHESWPFLLPLSVWDNDNKVSWVDLPAGKHGLFVGETLRSGPHLRGDSSWEEFWGWGRLRSCKETSNYVPVDRITWQTALTEGGYCWREVLNCETSLCAVVGVEIVTKIRQRGKLSPFAISRGRTNSGGGRLHMHLALPLTNCVTLEKSFHLSSWRFTCHTFPKNHSLHHSVKMRI